MPEDKTARLVIGGAGGVRYEFPLEAESVTIGRGEDCDLVLDDGFASRHHARIEVQEHQYELTDLGSTNGTFVDGGQIAGVHTLSDGQQIQIGDTDLLFVEEGAEESRTRRRVPVTKAQLASHVQVDVGSWEVWVEGKKLEQKLSVLEFKFLALLYGRLGSVYSRDELGCELWGEGAYNYEMLHQLVHRLKQRIEPDPKHPRYLASVPGVGYKLLAGRSPG